MMPVPLRVLQATTVTARADHRAMYTWRTWVGGWLLRILAQVTFFALMGRLVASADAARYLAVGNAVAVAALESMMVVASAAWERRSGTFPLLVVAPGPLALVFVGRGLQWVVEGSVCAMLALVLVGPIFDVPLTVATVLACAPLVLLVSISTYGLGLVVAALVMRTPRVRAVVSNVGFLVLAFSAGIYVPVSALPGWLQLVGEVLPVRHGLAAVRGVIDGAPASAVLGQTALEVLVATAWFAAALTTFRVIAEGGRRSGTIEFS